MSDLRTLVSSAYETARRGYYRDALEEFHLILEHNPGNPDALYGASACLLRLERLEEAARVLETLLRIAPVNAAARQLEEEIRREQLALASLPSREEPFLLPGEEEDPFGTGAAERSREIIPEWAPPMPARPTFAERVRAGENLDPGVLRLGAVWRTARSVYRGSFRKLYLSGLIALVAQVGVISLFLSWVIPLAGSSPFIATLLALVGGLLSTSLLGMHALYCHRVLTETDPPMRRMGREALEQVFGMCAANGLMLLPLLLRVAWGMLGSHEMLWWDSGLLAAQGLIVARCWFLNLVTGIEELHPAEAVAKALRGTGRNWFGVFVLIAGQLILFLPAVLFLGLGYPLLNLVQAEAYRQIYRSGEE